MIAAVPATTLPSPAASAPPLIISILPNSPNQVPFPFSFIFIAVFVVTII